MNLPGFTAEAALHKTTECYQMTRTSATLTNGGELVPQFAHWSYCDESGCYICTPWGCRRIGPITRE